jgi:hypothetical protein
MTSFAMVKPIACGMPLIYPPWNHEDVRSPKFHLPESSDVDPSQSICLCTVPDVVKSILLQMGRKSPDR